jgi:hypothetical protein
MWLISRIKLKQYKLEKNFSNIFIKYIRTKLHIITPLICVELAKYVQFHHGREMKAFFLKPDYLRHHWAMQFPFVHRA